MKKEQIPQNVLQDIEYTVRPDGMTEQVEKELFDISADGQAENTDGVIFHMIRDDREIGRMALAAESGYKIFIADPEEMTEERRLLFDTYRGYFTLVTGSDAVSETIRRAREAAAPADMKNKVVAALFPDSRTEAAMEMGILE